MILTKVVHRPWTKTNNARWQAKVDERATVATAQTALLAKASRGRLMYINGLFGL